VSTSSVSTTARGRMGNVSWKKVCFVVVVVAVPPLFTPSLQHCTWQFMDFLYLIGIDRGKCNCSMRFNPYNRYEPYYKWSGTDCSWLAAYNAGGRLQVSVLSVSMVVAMSLYVSGMGAVL
jgi:hypothetical protein